MSNTAIQEMMQYKGLYITQTDNAYMIYNKDMRLIGKADNLLEVRLLIDMIRG